ncbi:DUF3240 family protein [Methylotetracoccus oryzae]|uniref:DUF3240 family protein n=1 Tax=Methylotetracoccus oryzae TaxID=1919059 RepID=UPI001119FEB0|nr:DUF3240 family protein [Methylotetracoccus oryzae]
MTEGYLLLSLTVPPKLEESLIDWLLDFDSRCGFTSFPVNGHSGRSDGLTLAEQVSGRKQNVRFEICLPQAEVDRLIDALCRDFSNTGVVYWVTSVVRFGRAEPAGGDERPAACTALNAAGSD